MNLTCKRCRTRYSPAKAEYVFPLTGGLCWSCHDKAKEAAYRATLTPSERLTVAARQAAIEAVSQAEINLHCQFGGLPKIRRR